MTSKKLVDDYYANISGNDDVQGDVSLVKKPKIKVKKKSVTDDDNTSNGEVGETQKVEATLEAEKKPKLKTKKIVQKLDVVNSESLHSDDKEPSHSQLVNEVEKPQASPIENKVGVEVKRKEFTVIKKEDRIQERRDFSQKRVVEKRNESDVQRPSFSVKKAGEKEIVKEPVIGADGLEVPVDLVLKPGIGIKKNFFSKTSKGKEGVYKSDEEERGKKVKSVFSSQKKTRGKFTFEDEEDLPVTFVRSNKMAKKQKEDKKIEDIKQNLVNRTGETVVIQDVLSVKELSEKIGVGLALLMAEFMKNGVLVNINSKIDFETASIVVDAFQITLERDMSSGASVEDVFAGDLSSLLAEDDPLKLKPRSPVVSIMGHVDHGKTSLLDYIRKTKVTSGEAGGITQSIGAYQADLYSPQEKFLGKVTFLDTPGHEAFTVMRARGAKSTDIAVLVVAADEGVKPQTIESINHAKEAGIPVIVAINKMDKAGANPDFIKSQLAEKGLVAEDWGGNTPFVPVSALTGFGIDELLEMILLVAEMKELKANPDRNGIATVIESHLDLRLGPVATVLVNTGTIKAGSDIVCQDSFGKIKVLKNYKNENVKFVLPGEPALIVGLDKVVVGGDILQVVNTPELAKQKALKYREMLHENKKAHASGLELIMHKIQSGNLKQLKLIVKADTNGSLEAIKASLLKLSTEQTTISIIHSGVGNITEGDILMGQGSEAILVGFNVGVLSTAKGILESLGVEYISSDIIYHITEKIEKIVTGMFDPKEIEVELGKATVAGIFYTDKAFMVVGLALKSSFDIENPSKIETKGLLRVLRNKKFIGTGKIESLKKGTIEVKDLEGPTECGIKFSGTVVLEMGDELEIYKVQIVK